MVVFPGITEWRNEWNLFRSQRMGQLFLILLLMVVVYQLLVQRAWVDTGEYLRKAESLFSGWQPQLGDRVLEQSRRTPAFGLLLLATGPLYTLISAVATLCLILSLRNWVRHMSSYRRAPELVTFFFLLHPLTWIYAVVPMPELWCLVLLVAWLRSLSNSRPWAMSWQAAGLLALKPVFVLLIPFNILAVLMLPGFRRRIRPLLVSLVFPILIYLTTWGYNYRAMGVGHYSSMGICNAVEYNLPAYQPNFHYQEEGDSPSEALLDAKGIIQGVLKQRAFQAIGIHLRGVVVGLLDPGRYDAWSFLGASGDMGVMQALNERRWPTGASIGGLIFMVLGAILNGAFLFFVVRGLRPLLGYRQHVFFLLFSLVWLGLVGPVASARYTFLLYPLLSLWFADGWSRTFASKT
jgi:hypothetical protein